MESQQTEGEVAYGMQPTSAERCSHYASRGLRLALGLSVCANAVACAALGLAWLAYGSSRNSKGASAQQGDGKVVCRELNIVRDGKVVGFFGPSKASWRPGGTALWLAGDDRTCFATLEVQKDACLTLQSPSPVTIARLAVRPSATEGYEAGLNLMVKGPIQAGASVGVRRDGLGYLTIGDKLRTNVAAPVTLWAKADGSGGQRWPTKSAEEVPDVLTHRNSAADQ